MTYFRLVTGCREVQSCVCVAREKEYYIRSRQ